MEITCGDDLVIIREYIGIVCDAIDLCNENIFYIEDGIVTCAMYLWDASEGVRVLHMLFGLLNNFAVFQ